MNAPRPENVQRTRAKAAIGVLFGGVMSDTMVQKCWRQVAKISEPKRAECIERLLDAARLALPEDS